MFTVRAHAKRILRRKLAKIADASEPGGGDFYDGLTEEEKGALGELLALGFSKYDLFSLPWIDTGSLPLLAGSLFKIDPTYRSDFWRKKGYLGSDPASSVHRDRIRYRGKILSVSLPERNADAVQGGMSGVDNAWQKARSDLGWKGKAKIELENAPQGDVYCEGLFLTVTSGAQAGLSVPVEAFEKNCAVIGVDYTQADMIERLGSVQAGDAASMDNSDYLALQTYHRHQVPKDGEMYEGFRQFVDADGSPKYPQRDVWIGPMFAASGAGGLQSGSFSGKMIVIEALMDESAFPWQADWYRKKVNESHGGNADGDFRLWYIDKAFHGDDGMTFDDFHLVPYLGALHQALLDVSDWVEKGVEPAPSTVYEIKDGQVLVPEKDRKGIQPSVCLLANGGKCADIRVGENVRFLASAYLSENAGVPVRVEWSFDGEPFVQGTCKKAGDEIYTAEAEHRYAESGTRFAVVRFTFTRGGLDDAYTYVQNIDRARVVVK